MNEIYQSQKRNKVCGNFINQPTICAMAFSIGAII